MFFSYNSKFSQLLPQSALVRALHPHLYHWRIHHGTVLCGGSVHAFPEFGEGLPALLSSWLLSRVIRAVSYIPDGAEESAMDGGEV